MSCSSPPSLFLQKFLKFLVNFTLILPSFSYFNPSFLPLRNDLPLYSPSCAYYAALWVPSFSAIMCAHYNRYGAHSKLVTLAAGFASGFLAMEAQKEQPLRRRVIMSMLNMGTETLYRLLASAGVVKLIPKGECLVFALASAFMSYSYLNHREETADLLKRPLEALEGDPKCEKPATFISSRIDAKLKIPVPFAASPVGYIVSGSLRALLLGLALKSIGKILDLLKSLKKTPAAASSAAQLASLSSQNGFLDRFGFVLFLFAATALYRTARQFIRMNQFEDKRWAAYLPGLALGLSSFLYPSLFLSQTTLSQALTSAWNIVIAKGLIIPPTKGTSILFGACTAVVFYAGVFNKNALRPFAQSLLSKLSDGNFSSLPKLQ